MPGDCCPKLGIIVCVCSFGLWIDKKGDLTLEEKAQIPFLLLSAGTVPAKDLLVDSLPSWDEWDMSEFLLGKQCLLLAEPWVLIFHQLVLINSNFFLPFQRTLTKMPFVHHIFGYFSEINSSRNCAFFLIAGEHLVTSWYSYELG